MNVDYECSNASHPRLPPFSFILLFLLPYWLLHQFTSAFSSSCSLDHHQYAFATLLLCLKLLRHKHYHFLPSCVSLCLFMFRLILRPLHVSWPCDEVPILSSGKALLHPLTMKLSKSADAQRLCLHALSFRRYRSASPTILQHDISHTVVWSLCSVLILSPFHCS